MRPTLYYEIAANRKEYLGVRYFKWMPNTGEVITVVCAPGSDVRRGRSNNVGIYYISQMTFFSNYVGYAVPCKQTKYEEAFNKVLAVLK